jgi:hypothetical protein
MILASCSKPKGDKTAPVITIISPANNQQFTAGQTIQIMANASDNDKVTEMHIHVKNKATGDLLRDIHAFPGQTNGSIQDSFAAGSAIIYSIEIYARDPSQNLGTSIVEVIAN